MEYALNIDSFQGPLDLLLHLIKEAKMDIFDLKMLIMTALLKFLFYSRI